MKRFLPLLFAGAALALVPIVKPVVLLWDYPVSDLSTNLIFVMHGTTNLTTPQPWPVEAILYATNSYSNGVWLVATQANGSATFQMTLSVQAGAHFYYVTASNTFWEIESVPSNTLGLDALPTQSGNLRAKKGF